jgi:CBS domain containing-hemolysin-like protein
MFHWSFFKTTLQKILSLFHSKKSNKEEDDIKHYLEQISSDDIMQSRGHTFAINLSDSLSHIGYIFSKSDSIVLPVYYNKIDNIIGSLSYKKYLTIILQKDTELRLSLSLKEIVEFLQISPLQKVLFISEYMDVFTLLKKMTLQKIELAVVVDEFGGTDGYICINDIIDYISQSLTITENSPVCDKDGFFYLSGSADLEVVFSIIQKSDFEKKKVIEILENSLEEYDTINGLLCSITGRVPEKNEKIQVGEATFFIMESSPKKIRKIKFHIQNVMYPMVIN